jgi:type I restriction enzyme S subunit
MSFPRYPKYKESGVEWLGQVPEHWEINQGRRLFLQEREPSREGDDQLSATQKYGVVPQKLFMEMEDQKVTLALGGTDNFKHVEKGDFVISLRSFQGGIEHSKYQGCVSPAYTVLRPSLPICSQFWAYLLKSKNYIEALQTMTDGIRDGKNISYQQFGQIRLPVAAIAEQTAIADFLNRETAKIDGLIAEQERLIELLKEKRQAVISHVVTKGLYPDVPMKDLGIEWLGQVPDHWSVGPVKRVIQAVESGTSVNAADEPADEGSLGVLKTSCVYTGNFRPEENKTVVDEERGRVSCPLKAGALIVSRMNTPDLVGAAGFVQFAPENIFLPDRLWQIVMKDCDGRFIHFWTRTANYRAQVEAACTGTSSSMKNLGQDQFGMFSFAVPPLSEQTAIVTYLDSEVGKLDTLTAEAQKAISLLQERRSALISAAVTGQIDVREWQHQKAA